MKTTIEISVNDREEAKLIRRALTDPVMRAVCIMVGALKPLDDESRRHVLREVHEKLNLTA